MVATLQVCKAVLFFGGTGLLLALEQWRPFKPYADPKLRRWARNFFIAITNSLVIEVFFSAAIVAYISWLARQKIGLLYLLNANPVINVPLTILFMDFITYVWHRAYHEVPWMWRLHRAHHADRDLDVTTANRFHLGEILLSTLYRVCLLTLWGPTLTAVLIFETVMLAFNQLEHSNLKLPDRLDAVLRKIFVTPDMHRVHHSDVKAHTNSNYSTIFSFWDRIFRSYQVEGVSQQAIRIGLKEYPKPKDVTLAKVLALPFGSPCPLPIINPAPGE